MESLCCFSNSDPPASKSPEVFVKNARRRAPALSTLFAQEAHLSESQGSACRPLSQDREPWIFQPQRTLIPWTLSILSSLPPQCLVCGNQSLWGTSGLGPALCRFPSTSPFHSPVVSFRPFGSRGGIKSICQRGTLSQLLSLLFGGPPCCYLPISSVPCPATVCLKFSLGLDPRLATTSLSHRQQEAK